MGTQNKENFPSNSMAQSAAHLEFSFEICSSQKTIKVDKLFGTLIDEKSLDLKEVQNKVFEILVPSEYIFRSNDAHKLSFVYCLCAISKVEFEGMDGGKILFTKNLIYSR